MRPSRSQTTKPVFGAGSKSSISSNRKPKPQRSHATGTSSSSCRPSWSIDRLLQLGQMKYGIQAKVALDPTPATEPHELRDRRGDDQRPRPEIPVLPVDLREVVAEVLAVEPDDERGHEQQGGDRGQALRHLVLVVGDLGDEVVAHACDQVAGELQPVDCAQDLVVGAAEVDLDVVRSDLLALLDLDDVDLVVERVDEVEIVLGDVVDEPVEHHPGLIVRLA